MAEMPRLTQNHNLESLGVSFFRRHWAYLVLGGLVLLGGALRFYGFAQRGLVLHDEAAYLLEARSIEVGLSIVKGNLGELTRGGFTFAGEGVTELLGSIQIFTAHPGHTFLLWLTGLPTGVHDYTGILLSATLGTANIILVFLIGRRMFGVAAGLLAAAVLAVSEYDLAYSRSALPETTVSFFFTLGMLLYYLSLRRGRRQYVLIALAGLCAGYAFTAHYRVALVPALFVAYEIANHLCSTKRQLALSVKRLSFLGFGMLLPPLAFEGAYRLMLLVSSKATSYPFTYLEQLQGRFERFSPFLTLTDSSAYFKYIWNLEHPVVSVMLIVGVALMMGSFFRRFSMERFILLSGFLILFIFFTIYTNTVPRLPRNLVVVLPLISLIAGWGTYQLATKMRSLLPTPLAVSAFGLAIIGVGLFHNLQLVPLTSGYKEAVTESSGYILTAQRQVCVDLYHYPVWKFYLDELNGAGTAAKHLDVCSWWEVRNMAVLSSLGILSYGPGQIQDIRGSGPPIVKVENDLGLYRPYMYDAQIDIGTILDIEKNPDWDFVQVFIMDEN